MPDTPVKLEQVERDSLCDLLVELGPEAPTLCEGWSTSDLAVHLIVCEARPHAWLAVPMGDRVPSLRRYFDRMVQRERAVGWLGLVARVRRGPAYGPTANRWFRDQMMFREMLIHHEDVRRANGLAPRTGVDAQQQRAWQKVPAFAKRMLAVSSGRGLELVHPDGRTRMVREGSPVVQVVGDPIEQLLYVFGRTSAARVELVGDTEAVRVRDSSALAALPRIESTDRLST